MENNNYLQDWIRNQIIKGWQRKFNIAKNNAVEWREVYKSYLGSTLWNKKKREILIRANGYCEQCGNYSLNELDIHHVTYDRVGGLEESEDLIALCYKCHQKADQLRDRETSLRRDAENYSKGLDTFGTKKHGKDWETDPGYDVVLDEFEEWKMKKSDEDFF